MLHVKRYFAGKSDFFKNVTTLLTGTLVSQIIPLAVTPILTRLYTPEQFAPLALYLSVVGIFAVLATGTYEKAIIIPKGDKGAINLVMLAFALAVSVTILLLVVALLFSNQLIEFYSSYNLGTWILFIPFSVLSLACYTIINTWLNRAKEYKRLSVNRVSRASISSGTAIMFGFFSFGSMGLILSEFIGQLIATSWFARFFVKKNQVLLQDIRSEELVDSAKEFRQFPYFTMPSDLLSMASYQLPVFVFSRIFLDATVGFYSLCIRVLDKPFMLFTSSIYEVFRQRAIEDFNERGECLTIYKKTFTRLVMISIPAIVGFYVSAPLIFEFVFGAEWRQAGHYARILSVMYLFKFVSAPLSFTFFIAKKQRLDFILHIYIFISCLLVLLAAYHFEFSVENTLIAFVANYCFVYIFYLVKSYQFAHGPNKKLY